ncbi:Ger(x)C family spore germination protein [Clostridium sp. ZS2-4]|uniref:Ger(x)C family spore germination protein n=1 Tax=Clostridium sp. ZS2-4 TaxID=2987703 RepID=UPI00227B7D6D|nr:Ger(x)C family spore germination protein [Clostridium sp. ZS2-4]MCY6355744.1 Ger(x)C family spore germination protein [Clostridium sp. ZS2-4]
MKKIWSGLVIAIVNCILMTGCFSYKDINKILFVTAVLVDIDNDNKPIVYCEAFKAKGGDEKGEGDRIIFKGKGKTCFEAVREISLGSSFKLNYTQNKVLIFGSRAAEYGLDNFMDFFDRDQEMLIRPFIGVYDGECEMLLQADLDEEKYLGVYVMELINNVGASSRAIQLSLNQYLNQRLVGDKTSIAPLIKLQSGGMGNKVEIDGGAILKEDKMVGIISKQEGQGFNFLMNSVKSGTLEPKNPEAEDKFVTLEILKSKTKTEIKYEEDKIKLIKNIKVKASVGEVQEKLVINDNTLKVLEMTSEENIKKACRIIFNQYKDDGIDIFDIEEELHRKYPKVKKNNPIKITELIVNADVEITHSGDTLNFIK